MIAPKTPCKQHVTLVCVLYSVPWTSRVRGYNSFDGIVDGTGASDDLSVTLGTSEGCAFDCAQDPVQMASRFLCMFCTPWLGHRACVAGFPSSQSSMEPVRPASFATCCRSPSRRWCSREFLMTRLRPTNFAACCSSLFRRWCGCEQDAVKPGVEASLCLRTLRRLHAQNRFSRFVTETRHCMARRPSFATPCTMCCTRFATC